MVKQGTSRVPAVGPTSGMIRCRDTQLVEQFKLMFVDVFPLPSRKSLVW